MRSASAVNSRQWQLAIARAHREDSARARPSAWALNSRQWQLAAARAHREDSARARRGLLEKPSPSCQRHDTSPKGGGETWLCASFWQRTYLAPPSGPLRPGGTLPNSRPSRQARRLPNPLKFLSLPTTPRKAILPKFERIFSKSFSHFLLRRTC